MLGELPANSLLTADAGFTGYDFAKTVLQSGCELLIRVGSNVTLLKKLGYVRESGGTVFVPASETVRVLTVWHHEAEVMIFSGPFTSGLTRRLALSSLRLCFVLSLLKVHVIQFI